MASLFLDGQRPNVFSDSRAAVRAFTIGSIPKEAHCIPKEKVITPHMPTCFPAHTGFFEEGLTNLNELALSKARELTFRVHVESPRPTTPNNRDSPTTYKDVPRTVSEPGLPLVW
ncbi:hypothetical protein HPB52_025422 [Rhipicephalus sanguineus]|uniref:Uncharacterized protein n=1 Tax=Rhipicephalus sanguineus TaxID=34632 RepID=A0A9D4TD43_RHISA|nr:hypothetical protein HPB52_025422 [Rhipicephalus sanguineus]